MTLEAICKELRVKGVYTYLQEYYPDRPDLEDLLVAALQRERDLRRINR